VRVPRRTREETRTDNRRALLDSARRLMTTEGVDVPLDRVAAAAGLTTGAVYSIFGSKSDLLVALLAEALAEQAETTDHLADPALDLGDVLAGYARAWIERVGPGGPAEIRLDLQVVLLATQDGRLRERCLHLVRREEERLAALLTDRRVAARARRTDEAEAVRIATALRALGVGFALRAVLDGSDPVVATAFPDACAALVALADER
jgi:AcrR family transcriptional regulator